MIQRLIIVFTCVFTFTNVIQAQNINSPYSLFALGAESKIGTGGLSGMGNAGIADKSFGQVNLFNPASLGSINSQTFLQEFGVNGIYSTLQNRNTTESATKGNVSHLAFAFSAKKGWGFGFGLLPYTTTGYNIDIEKNIEGSDENFTTRITGTGGLNKFYLSTGAKIGSRLSLGLDFSVLFGSIDQDSQLVSGSFVSIEQTSFHKGVKLTTGLQYDLFLNKKNRTTIGAVVELPTVISGRQTTSSNKITPLNSLIIIDDVEETSLDDFEMPWSVGLGVSSSFNQVRANLDYKKTFWSDTNQKFNNERYTNQTTYAVGAEYQNVKKYKRTRYRLGANYNTGFLNISGTQISSYFGSVGVGLPLNSQGTNIMNISYSYGKEGQINSGLIQETVHKLTLNLSLNGNWFRKRKIN